MAIKIDLEKAYDRLKWSFIRDTLLQNGIPLNMIEVIMNCITSCNMNFLWNGSLMDTFQPSRGVRQGDLLSPYIFVMCLERLSQLIDEVVSSLAWKPIKTSSQGPIISHLFYTDDLVLFVEASIDQVVVIKSCLDRFCSASRERVNYNKSSVIFSQKVNENLASSISNLLNIYVVENFGSYLGAPTAKGRVSKTHYQHVLDRVNAQLSSWKAKYLSFAGRITLVKSTISCIPFYSMQTLLLPRLVCDEIDKKCKGFVWSSTDKKERKSTWLSRTR